MTERKSRLETQVLIIGGGVTGTGLARDLALRGIACILAEKSDLNAGASGANHGLLHSGARYVFGNPADARACREENRILKRIARGCIEDTGGLYVAVKGDDENFIADFPRMCADCSIPIHPLDIATAREMEPALSANVIAAYGVRDAAIDPFKLCMENMAQARTLGSTLLRHTEVTGFSRWGGKIRSVQLTNLLTGEEVSLEADQVVNAAGAWANMVAQKAGVRISMIYSKGSLLVTHNRITKHVINRLRKPANGDILVPGGTVSILGTTSVRVENPNLIYPTVQEIDDIVSEVGAMLPAVENTRMIRAYAGVRPLIESTNQSDDRLVSRGISLLDHARDGLENFTTITGGKLTTYRLMAEKAADLVCDKLGLDRPCRTADMPLPSTQYAKWTKPGLSPKIWFDGQDPNDFLICECEMVPKSAVDALIASIHEQNGRPDLISLGLRSRIGKGACQGTMCGIRLTAYLYDIGELETKQDIGSLKEFLRGRWRGVRPLLWDASLRQTELLEGIYCGSMGLDL